MISKKKEKKKEKRRRQAKESGWEAVRNRWVSSVRAEGGGRSRVKGAGWGGAGKRRASSGREGEGMRLRMKGAGRGAEGGRRASDRLGLATLFTASKHSFRRGSSHLPMRQEEGAFNGKGLVRTRLALALNILSLSVERLTIIHGRFCRSVTSTAKRKRPHGAQRIELRQPLVQRRINLVC